MGMISKGSMIGEGVKLCGIQVKGFCLREDWYVFQVDINLCYEAIKEDFYFFSFGRVMLGTEEIWNRVQILDLSSVNEIFLLNMFTELYFLSD